MERTVDITVLKSPEDWANVRCTLFLSVFATAIAEGGRMDGTYRRKK